ncbi:MAG: acido-empty-quinoprotein group A, partial [Acidobacteria bacterium]
MNRMVVTWLLLIPGLVAAQSSGLDPATLRRPLADSWPSYSGDLTGRRYSTLKQINKSNVRNLSLSWVARGLTQGSGATGRGASLAGGAVGRGGGGGRGGSYPLTVSGEGTGEYNTGGPAAIRGSILMVDGVLYPTSPDNVWAVDARDGTMIWQYYWKTRGGTHTGHRGVGMWRNFLFSEFHDDYLVKLDARTGRELWHVPIADFEQQYFSSMAPIVIDDHVLVGTGNDLDAPGFLQAYDPDTGRRQWILYTVPMNPGDPGLETWPNLEAARHGGGQAWVPGVFDPETRYYIFGTGNPTPAYTPAGRGDGVGLFTCSLVAVHVDTGKMAWYYQTSPRDMHDWDSSQTPVLIDAMINGRPRKLVSTAARNGYFFTVDRVTGAHVATGKFSSVANWAKGLDEEGRPVLNPEKVATIPGTIVNGSTTNWPPPAYSPDTGLFYVPENNGLSIVYLIDPDPRGSMGLGGRQGSAIGGYGNFITAIDPKTAKVTWRHELPGAGGATGMLTTAGGLLFAGDGAGNLVAFDASNGALLWHARLGNVSNAPQ